MDDIRREIVSVFSIIGDTGTLDAKTPVQILVDIEISLNEYMKILKYVHNEDRDKDGRHTDILEKAVIAQEKARKTIKQEEQKAAREREESAQNAKLQLQMKERMNKKVKKIGKIPMTQSQKPKLEKKEVKKEIDADTADQLLYLGMDLKMLG